MTRRNGTPSHETPSRNDHPAQRCLPHTVFPRPQGWPKAMGHGHGTRDAEGRGARATAEVEGCGGRGACGSKPDHGGGMARAWIETTRAEVSPKTHERYAEICRVHLVPALGTARLQRLSAADIQRAYNGSSRPAPRTRRHIHRILKSALARAVALGYLSRNPADAITRLPKVERQPPTTLTVAQAQALLAAIRHTTTYIPVLLALATGMRRGEIWPSAGGGSILTGGRCRWSRAWSRPSPGCGSSPRRQSGRGR